MPYLDNNATTRLDPDVLEAMLPFLTDEYANPSSPYSFARKPALAIARAREQVARLVGAEPEEIHFTSGGTESNNMALESAARTGRAIVVSAVEHASVRNAAQRIRDTMGYGGTFPVDTDGGPLLSETSLPAGGCLAAMWANNETGVIFPVQELARRARAANLLFHVDAIQAAGKIPVDLARSGADTAALSAHKLHGPKGVGALFVRCGVALRPLLAGGDQEQGLRPGTESVAGIVGFGAAAERALHHLADMDRVVRPLRDELEQRLQAVIPGLVIAGRASPRLPNTSMLLVPGCETEVVLALLDMDGLCVSSGSACAAGAQEPSPVLRAMGLLDASPAATIRVSLSRLTTPAEIDALVERLPVAVQRAACRP